MEKKIIQLIIPHITIIMLHLLGVLLEELNYYGSKPTKSDTCYLHLYVC